MMQGINSLDARVESAEAVFSSSTASGPPSPLEKAHCSRFDSKIPLLRTVADACPYDDVQSVAEVFVQLIGDSGRGYLLPYSVATMFAQTP